MPKSYRIRTQPGVDKSIRVQVEQDFDFLEILSLKLKQEDVYNRFCADYGVVVGRVIANRGTGVSNARVSIFVPLDDLDANDPVISTLYPYETVQDRNEDGYRYNLLPYRPSYAGHAATGTFPDIEDVLTRKEVLEVYEKYYKFTTKTNESGDFMIVGVPLGIQKIFLDMDLSDMGCFSLRPTDLIKIGRGTPEQFAGSQFLNGTDLDSLPQIVTANADIDVASFWGQEDLCNIGITRHDFDLVSLGIKLEPTAIFMGSIFSSNDNSSLRKNCKPGTEMGDLCNLVTGPGSILAIRQTVDLDINGDPILEQYKLESGGKVIDSDGTFVVEVPMNLDYVVTNEFGEEVLSNDPNVGIPTSAKYRFKIEYQSETTVPPSAGQILPIRGEVQRANVLVPNIREYGWTGTTLNPGIDPASLANDTSPNYIPNYTANTQWQLFNKSYAFSLDWDDYADKAAAISCEDYFYEMKYNKVYTTAQLIDEYRKGTGRARFIGIKEIAEQSCQGTNNPFPVTDGVRNFDFLFFLFNIVITLLTPVFFALILIAHVICFLWPVLRFILNVVLQVLLLAISTLCRAIRFLSFGLLKWKCPTLKAPQLPRRCPLAAIPLPNLSYPDCNACDCDSRPAGQPENVDLNEIENTTLLANTNQYAFFERLIPIDSDGEMKESWASKYTYGFQSSMSGYDDGEGNADYFKAPFMDDKKDEGGNPFTSVKTWSLDLTLSERMNLFNLKSKYHTDGSYNQIRTYVNPNLNSNKYHNDNVMVLLCDPSSLNNFTSGQIVSFQNPQLSPDVNVTGFTTGYTKTGQYSATVNYADPSNPQTQLQKTYFITGGTVGLVQDSTGQWIRDYNYASDVEYYQVITATTLYDYSATTKSLGASQPQLPTEVGYNTGPNDTLIQRFLFGYQKIKRGYIGTVATANNPIFYPDDTAVGLSGGKFQYNGANVLLNEDWKNHLVVFLVRGVDMYTDRQSITYDLSKLYGKAFGTGPTITGNFKMNVPVQSYSTGFQLPRHNLLSSNGNSSKGFLFFPSYSYTVGNNYVSYNTQNHLDYSCLDSDNKVIGNTNTTSYNALFNNVNGALSISNSSSWDEMVNVNNPKNDFRNGYKNNEIIEGGSAMFCEELNTAPRDKYRYFSPTYYTQYPTDVLPMTNTTRIIMRSERLPSSDLHDRRFLLHQNKRFGIYTIGDDGVAELAVSEYQTGSDTFGDLSDDFAEDGGGVAQTVLATFACDNMVPLGCYTGNGINFGVAQQTNDCYYVGNPQDDIQKMYGGCYYLVQRNFYILADFRIFAEWRSRFRMMFALCRNVVSLTFVNNWINGGLYMYSFYKDDIYNQPLSATTYNTLPTYRFCRDNIVFGEINNQFFYRVSPFNSSSNSFIGKVSPKKQNGDPYPASNMRNLGNPTTMTDLGPKDELLKEVCISGQFDGYVIDNIPTTSNSEVSDLLSLFVISRLSDATFWEQTLNAGDGSISKLFSRPGNRLDADIVQLMSINSEFGVTPYLGDNYSDENLVFLNTPTGPVLGVYFSANTINRDLVTPGRITFQDSTVNYLTNYYGFNDQMVPYQPWRIDPTGGSIFGTQVNDWNGRVSVDVKTIKYQSIDRLQGGNPSAMQPSFPSDVSTPSTQKPGYIYNSSSTGGINPTIDFKLTKAPMPNYIVTGAPYLFYFGLRKGKSAMNRFISNYIIGA